MRDRMYDGGAYCRSAFAAIAKTATAGGAGDNTQVASAWVDRKSDDYGMALSAKLVIVYEAALAAGETIAFAVDVRDADTIGGGNPAAYGDAITSTVVHTGNSGGETADGTVEVDIDLASARQFFQARITPNLSASGTDTLKWSAMVLLFGGDREPSSVAIGKIGAP